MTQYFSSNSHDLRIVSAEQLYARAALVQDLNSKEIKSATAVAWYRLPDKIPCGLSDCHQWHGRGYVARLPDGHEVHMGKDCGTSLLGEEWRHATNALDYQDRIRQLRITLDNALVAKVEIERELNALTEAPNGARWVARRKREFESTLPEQVIDRIKAQARRHETAVTIEVHLSADEIAKRSAGGQKVAPIETQVIGHLKGLQIWREAPGQIRKRIEEVYSAIEETDRQEDRERKLRPLAARALGIGDMVQVFRDFVAAGEDFFAPSNLSYLPSLTTDKDASRQTAKLIKRCHQEAAIA